VFAGQGLPTRQLDGTCCLVDDGDLFRRHEVRFDKKKNRLREAPEGFVELERDEETGARVGWVAVGNGPEDRWHREAWEAAQVAGCPADGTYELVGPQINGNPEGCAANILVAHDVCGDLLDPDDLPPRDYDGLRSWLTTHDVEGVVWHHPYGGMGKIKGRDFGIDRLAVAVPVVMSAIFRPWSHASKEDFDKIKLIQLPDSGDGR
jgi:hypothetical protein